MIITVVIEIPDEPSPSFIQNTLEDILGDDEQGWELKHWNSGEGVTYMGSRHSD